MESAKIIATGSYLPEEVLSNQRLESMVDTSDEWIVSRTGIKERRLASKNEFTSTMGVMAARHAMESAQIDPQEIDFIIVATVTPDYVFPSTACLIQKELKIQKAGGVDVQATCAGYLYALSLAKGLVESNQYKNVLVIASEKLSSIVDYKDRSTCILFGDGAAACIVSNQTKEGLSLESICLGADGDQAELLIVPAGGCRNPASKESVDRKDHYIKMAGNEVFKHAVRRMEASSKRCLEKVQKTEEEVSWLIPHQANERIIDAIAKRFTHLSENQIYKTVRNYGNTSASSIGIALDELMRKGCVKAGENILLTAFGGGFTYGAVLLQYQEGDKG